ncbi:alpha-glucan family phosphorylase [candidate division WOR-3 bacterium]|nr:alpha-glucan family phosphorylase [candidate division WOR-3 bacterium]
MKPVRTFKVIPSLPEELADLRTIAFNLWWGWNEEAVKLFHRISPELWEQANHNPVALLSMVPQENWYALIKDESFIAHMNRVKEDLDEYLGGARWFEREHSDIQNAVIAYFSMEFGLNDCLPLYSGGLGVLSGDHLKSSSELGIPLVAVGLLYGQGYLTQYLSNDGWQHEKYAENDFSNMPVRVLNVNDGSTLKISVKMAEKEVWAEIWETSVGRIKLYLLNTNIPENDSLGRYITERLYGGDNDLRIKQEILLGIGGLKALRKIGLNPTVVHMNEGHSAFIILERIRQLMKENGLTYTQAKLLSASSCVFTTHTPVPAGNEVFHPDMIEHYIGYIREEIGVTKEELYSLGKQNPKNASEHFGMTVFAINNSHYCNAVSKLHASVSRSMWSGIWQGLDADEVPITHITNGINPNSWTSGEMQQLFLRYIGPKMLEEPENLKIWERVLDIPDNELWRTHERRRERLVAFIRRRLKKQLAEQGASAKEIEEADEVLHPDTLTIGFSRRFATYKRASLILSNLERITKILTNKDKPVQLIFAGKAHPRDDAGKDIIKHIFQVSRMPHLRNHIVFIQNYDMNVARYMVQGCDIWLNTPRRPLEASGTSGMKVCFNGGLNLSVLDGWWNEAFNGKNGWSIGMGEVYQDYKAEDEVESSSLYDTLENDVVPKFYNIARDGLPREWIKMIKESMRTLCPVFNTNRMICEYTEKFYIPSHNSWRTLTENDFKGVKDFSSRFDLISREWNNVKIIDVSADTAAPVQMGTQIEVVSTVYMDGLNPDDVSVEICHGKLSYNGEIENPSCIAMSSVQNTGKGQYVFRGRIPCLESGKNGFSVRILPRNNYLTRKLVPGFVKWFENGGQ